ncbi:MAG: hypothetical protein ACR2HV_00850 [Acidimicrobiales bacterium]
MKPITGQADLANIALPLDAWERVDEQLEIRRSVDELVEHLNEHVEYYHKAIWWRMDRDRLLMMLDGFYVPDTNNVSVASIVDREPVAIIGNSLVYAVGAASFLGYGKITTPAALVNLYADRKPVSDPLLVSLPTDGLYAQTIMDECAALEDHYGNTDWVLDDPEPELGSIDPALLGSRQTDTTPGTTPTPFPGTIINLQNAPDAPAPQGFDAILSAVTNANAFRDMAGLAGTQANARAALETAAGLATNFGNQAAALELAKLAKAEQGTRTADQKLASIKNAKDKGLATDADATAQAKSVLEAMNPDAGGTDPPHTDPAINAAIDAATEVPGSTIEATTGEGSTRVTIGDDKEDSKRGPFIIEVDVTPGLRCFDPGTNFTGKTKLSVRGKGLPRGATLRWSVPPSETGKYTITQSTSPSGVSTVEISGIRPGVSAIDVEAIRGGTVLQSIKFPLSIPQFVTIDDDNAQVDAFMTANNFHAVQSEILDAARDVVRLLLLSEANVRLIWKSSGGSVPAHVPAGFVTKVSILNNDPSGQETTARRTQVLRPAAWGHGIRRGRQRVPRVVPRSGGGVDRCRHHHQPAGCGPGVVAGVRPGDRVVNHPNLRSAPRRDPRARAVSHAPSRAVQPQRQRCREPGRHAGPDGPGLGAVVPRAHRDRRLEHRPRRLHRQPHGHRDRRHQPPDRWPPGPYPESLPHPAGAAVRQIGAGDTSRVAVNPVALRAWSYGLGTLAK